MLRHGETPHGDERLRATLIKWRNRHDTCLRADRGALAQMHWPCRQLLLRCSTSCIHAVAS
ncbi:MAG TPA: hypothetical protein VFN25_03210, partial [Dokdonella sp.]|uniref:hypothetical protein n=1 Tax=Dokdonella sp. TaxID=2291710 RepID=UPI002D7F830F